MYAVDAERERRRRRLVIPERLGTVLAVVSSVYGIPRDALLAPSRAREEAAKARQVAMYLAHAALKLSVAEVALGFGRTRQTVWHALRTVEEMREDGDVDRTLRW